MNTLLELLEQDCTQSPAQLAAQAGMTEAEAKDELRRLEEEGVILDEVESLYLMSGSFDLTVIISGRSLREVAQFVGERLAPLEGVTGTATHFILKKYKEKHLIFRPQEPQEREYIFV